MGTPFQFDERAHHREDASREVLLGRFGKIQSDNADDHGIVTDGLHLKIRGDTQFPCIVLLAGTCIGHVMPRATIDLSFDFT